ncbi:MAG: oligosaccharide flippase family protein [Actinomycetia bacterium]|nr:oligosaccharide flippase family protein [Actinomycetes bacterium]
MTAAQLVEPLEPGASSGLRSATRGSVLNIVGALTTAVVGFVTVGVITNNYGQVGAGLFLSATALFTLASNGARLGGESSLTFFVSRLRANGQHGALKPLMRIALGSTLMAAGTATGIGLVMAPELSRLLTSDPGNVSTMTTTIRIFALAVPSFAVSQVLFGATRAFGTMRPSVWSGQIIRPVAQFLLVVVAVAVSAEIWPLAAAWATASLIATISVALWLRWRLRRDDWPPSPFRAAEYWRFAAPRSVTDLVASVLERLDILLVAYFLSESDAGIYGASSRLIVVSQLLMYATAQSMAPHISVAFMQGRHQQAKELLSTITAWNVALLWPLLIGLAFGAETVLGLFGEGFADGAAIVQVLALSLLVIIGLGVGDTMLLMAGDSVASLASHVIALTVMLVTSALLLPQVGLIGAAWAWALSRLTIRSLAAARVWYTSRIHVFGRPVILAAVVSTVSFVPTGFAVHHLIDSGWLAILAHLVAGGIIHIALSACFRRELQFAQLYGILSRRPQDEQETSR